VITWLLGRMKCDAVTGLMMACWRWSGCHGVSRWSQLGLLMGPFLLLLCALGLCDALRVLLVMLVMLVMIRWWMGSLMTWLRWLVAS